ncbi:MAG: dynamin family protein, partial [Proteobacteria bacterium]|nr:dynamin family protein [Pseudomonadota bacterium]
MPGFSQRERTRIAAALVEVERCLTEATHALDAAAARFSSVPDDATPLQRRLIADYAERFREAMAALADRYRVQIEPAGRSARQRARDALDRAMVVVEELGPRRFLTDGEPSDELASELRRIVSQLQEPLDAMRAVLTGAAIVPAPAVSSAASGDGALLADIARVIAAHELGELAPALQCLAGRFKQNDLEIAAFGRVNSGKSSLLNAFLGEPLLPVGLTPVTAIDIH